MVRPQLNWNPIKPQRITGQPIVTMFKSAHSTITTAMEAMSWIDNVEHNWQAASDLTANDVHCARTLFICNAKLQTSYRHDDSSYDTNHNTSNVTSIITNISKSYLSMTPSYYFWLQIKAFFFQLKLARK